MLRVLLFVVLLITSWQICGMTVRDAASAVERGLVSHVDNVATYFCNIRCKERFDSGVRDPVCNMAVDPHLARKRDLFAPANGVDGRKGTQFFCAAKCKEKYHQKIAPTVDVDSIDPVRGSLRRWNHVALCSILFRRFVE
jgi:YHS domain-containing protein